MYYVGPQPVANGQADYKKTLECSSKLLNAICKSTAGAATAAAAAGLTSGSQCKHILALQTNKMLYLLLRCASCSCTELSTTAAASAGGAAQLNLGHWCISRLGQAASGRLRRCPLIASHFISPCHVLCSVGSGGNF